MIRAMIRALTRALSLTAAPLLCLAVAACGDLPTRAVTALPDDLPRFAPRLQPRGVARSNGEIAQDFLDLTFALEGGDILPRLLKFDGPVRVVLRSPGLVTYQPELNNLLNRLRREAGIDIAQTNDVANAQIHVQAISRATISRAFPGAACFIVPGVTSWREFRNPLGPEQLLWSRQERLSVVSIFIPADSTPQDTRDCLHEEMAQALGPANDLYRIPDTVFNDDNFHSILTPFDMLILRTLYDDRLRSGMSRQEVAAQLPGILNRVNPRGRAVAPRRRAPETRAWKSAIEGALDRRRARPARLVSAKRAINMAAIMDPPDHRLGLALLTRGRIEARKDPASAARNFARAYTQFTSQFGTDDIRAAHVALHLSLFALRDGRLDEAVRLARTHIPAARRAENAVVLSGLLAIEAEAFLAAGDVAQARKTRLESLAWARYAFGDEDGAIARAQAQIAAFNPNARTEP